MHNSIKFLMCDVEKVAAYDRGMRCTVLETVISATCHITGISLSY